MKLFLDDEREPEIAALYTKNEVYLDNDWIVVKSYDEFVNYIANNPLPELISFDHDLTHDHYRYAVAEYIPYNKIKEKTGYHCLLWFLLYCKTNNLKLPQMLIHTMNVTGQSNMENLISVYQSVAIK